MFLLDFLESLAGGGKAKQPTILKRVKLGNEEYDIVLGNTSLTHKPGPAGPVPLTIIQVATTLHQAPGIDFKLRGGDWNGTPKDLPIVPSELGKGFILAGAPEDKVVALFKNETLKENLIQLKNLRFDMRKIDDEHKLFFDGEVVFGTDLRIDRIKKMCRCIELVLGQLSVGTV